MTWRKLGLPPGNTLENDEELNSVMMPSKMLNASLAATSNVSVNSMHVTEACLEMATESGHSNILARFTHSAVGCLPGLPCSFCVASSSYWKVNEGRSGFSIHWLLTRGRLLLRVSDVG